MSERVLDEWVERITVAGMTLREDKLRVLIQPRPSWLPLWLWRKVIHRLLVIEETRML